MREGFLTGSDGVELTYAVSDRLTGRPWIVLIIPFGLRLSIAKPFFDFFGARYNIASWEARLIISPSQDLFPGAFELNRHVSDFATVLSALEIRQAVVVGYCSGAGIALAVANRYPHLISCLALVHGEYVLLDEPGCSTQFAREVDGLLTMANADEGSLCKIFEKVREERADTGQHRPTGIDLPFTELEYLRRHAQNYSAYKKNDFVKLASMVTHPALLLTGKRDAQANVASSLRIGDAMANAIVDVDEAADHYGLLREESVTLTTLWNRLGEQKFGRV